MNRTARSIILTLLLGAIAAVAGAWIGARYGLEQRQSPSLHAFVHEELALSAAQERRLEALEQDFAVRRRAREAELRAANADLAAAIQATHTFSPQVQAAIERFHGAMGELQKETILHVLEMRTVLTPAQAAKFDRRISEALTDERP